MALTDIINGIQSGANTLSHDIEAVGNIVGGVKTAVDVAKTSAVNGGSLGTLVGNANAAAANTAAAAKTTNMVMIAILVVGGIVVLMLLLKRAR